MLRVTQLVRKINAAVCEIQNFVAMFRRSYQRPLSSTSLIQSAPLCNVQIGYGAHSASCTMGTGSLSRR